jgi:hypothetical protein
MVSRSERDGLVVAAWLEVELVVEAVGEKLKVLVIVRPSGEVGDEIEEPSEVVVAEVEAIPVVLLGRVLKQRYEGW